MIQAVNEAINGELSTVYIQIPKSVENFVDAGERGAQYIVSQVVSACSSSDSSAVALLRVLLYYLTYLSIYIYYLQIDVFDQSPTLSSLSLSHCRAQSTVAKVERTADSTAHVHFLPLI